MRYLLFTALACLCALVAKAQTSPYKGIKQISVYAKTKTEKAPKLEYELHFDKNGNKTKYHHPTHYCTQEWIYNTQNQPTKYEVMCGESMSNGTTTYQYTAQTTISEEVTGAYKRVITDNLDAKKNVISRQMRYDKDLDGEKETKTENTTFTYNAQNRLTSSTTESSEAGKVVKDYAYKGDSLHLITRTVSGKKDTLLFQDYYRDSKQLASKRYPISEYDTKLGFYNEIYVYDDKGRITTLTKNIKSATDCPNPKIPCVVEMTEYYYKNDQLFQTKQYFYTKGNLSTYTITLLDKGIEREKKTYNAQNEFIEHTTYKIQKW